MKKPSVTQLIDQLAKPALIDWANRIGLQGIDIKAERAKSKTKGTSLHEQIEKYCLGTGDFERELDRQQFCLMMQGKKILAVEKTIETEWFVGRYDAMYLIDGMSCIVDYKSGFKGRVYLENKLQLVAYAMAEPADIAIVAIPQFHLIPVQLKDHEPYREMLIKLSELWHINKTIEKDEA